VGFDDFSFCVSIKKPGRVEDFYIKKIAEGVATLAASVYPKRIIVRLSDFKSNESLWPKCLITTSWRFDGSFAC